MECGQSRQWLKMLCGCVTTLRCCSCDVSSDVVRALFSAVEPILESTTPNKRDDLQQSNYNSNNPTIRPNRFTWSSVFRPTELGSVLICLTQLTAIFFCFFVFSSSFNSWRASRRVSPRLVCSFICSWRAERSKKKKNWKNIQHFL